MTRTRPRDAWVALALLTMLSLFVAFDAACDARPKTTSEPGTPRSRSGGSLVVIDLSKGVPEKDTSSILSVTHQGTFDELVHLFDVLGRDKNAKGVFVRFGSAEFGIARAMEIGEGLEAIRKTKPVICHAEGLGNSTYYAAARGCSKILVSPAGDLETVGIAAQLLYAHKLLALQLRLSVDILQVGKFKGAEEPLTRDRPSDEARASLQGVLIDLRARWLEGIVTGRGHPEAQDAVEDGPYSAKRAREVGLIDDVAYADDAREAARKDVGAVRDDVRFGPGNDESDATDELGDLVRTLSGGQKGSGAPVALVRATGSITMSRGGGLLGGSSGITAKEMERTLRALETDEDVRAVVLRIDSPGGSALASDLIWHRLMKLREKKPLVVSVGDMAASGGYYMACTGTVIFAEPTSIVGSIGVVGGKIAAENTLEMIGVHAETFPANVKNPKAAARAGYLSPLIEWDDDTRARVQESMTNVYELFLARIAEGRKTTPDKVAPHAEGRIFSGTEGKTRGLVDELGGLGAAIARARALANLPADARVEAISPSRNLLESIGAGGSSGDGEAGENAGASLAQPHVADLVAQIAPDLVPFVQSLLPLASGERTLAALPYAIVIR